MTRFMDKSFTVPAGGRKASQWPKCSGRLLLDGTDKYIECSHPDGWGHRSKCVFAVPKKEGEAQ